MATTLNLYAGCVYEMAIGTLGDIRTGCKLMLTTNSYTPDIGHQYRSEITGEVTDAGYTAGGSSVTITVTKEAVNRRTIISISEVEWAALITARYGILYRALGGAASADPLLAYLDFGANQSYNPFSLTASSLRFNY